ncbi:tRNA-dihydrouridine synthase C [Citrobacter amalonaticus]|nr:tRNA-dihydrouridine synthase C [Citrobacter amalonaticus]
MRVLLAPMEGVLDSLVRELLTEVNDYDLCITEFVRVVDQLLPVKVFHRLCPELLNGSRTPSGTLVRVQLLGQYPQWLAENAAAPWNSVLTVLILTAGVRQKWSTAAAAVRRC